MCTSMYPEVPMNLCDCQDDMGSSGKAARLTPGEQPYLRQFRWYPSGYVPAARLPLQDTPKLYTTAFIIMSALVVVYKDSDSGRSQCVVCVESAG
ncbi:hypothetical protein SCLCIDRAFT_1052669 [Scleroderma citrinum Foug A]|uniref:Uncharacterized protein n=1 Tax=Scleroderma citrinum Foug A TaxID=1036808 RepID=A0A0C3DSE6_9AGAM|nr:hypothetical protein SCLCIDRAFT_1052669 [Scleroderma citrinum Foug A]